MPKAKLTRAEQKIQRPLQILDAAFEEFTKRGFTATRVEDILPLVQARLAAGDDDEAPRTATQIT